MKESSTYQAILEEGRTKGRAEGHTQGAIAEARKLLRLRGEEAFGAPDARTMVLIEQLNDLTQLEELFQRVRSVGSWRELFGRQTNGPQRGRRKPSA